MRAGTPIALVCVLSSAVASGGCRQLFGLEDPTRGPTPVDAVVDTRGVDAAVGSLVNLGTASNYVVLARSSISGTGATVGGNVGISPAAASYITGFSLMADPSGEWSTSGQVTGRVYAADHGIPTPDNLATAVDDMQRAYAEAAALSPGVIVDAGNIDGMTLGPNVYRWSGGLSIAQDVALSGSATDVWIFQIAGTLNMSASTRIVLTGGALPSNVFWQSGGAVTLGAGCHLEGVVLAQTAFTSGANSSIKGRVLSMTDVNITGSTVVKPTP